MRPLSKDRPPIYQMDLADALAFIIGVFSMAIVIELFLLFIPGFSGLLLFIVGVLAARHTWPQIVPKYKLWQKTRDELRIFRVEIEKHEKEH